MECVHSKSMSSCCERIEINPHVARRKKRGCNLQCKNQWTVKLHYAYVHPQHQLKECQRPYCHGLLLNLTTP